MERRLILMRHAKSSWKSDAPDHDRPLNNRGRRDAPGPPTTSPDVPALMFAPPRRSRRERAIDGSARSFVRRTRHCERIKALSLLKRSGARRELGGLDVEPGDLPNALEGRTVAEGAVVRRSLAGGASVARQQW